MNVVSHHGHSQAVCMICMHLCFSTPVWGCFSGCRYKAHGAAVALSAAAPTVVLELVGRALLMSGALEWKSGSNSFLEALVVK